MIRKYILPLILSMVIFSLLDFYPTDCTTESSTCLTSNISKIKDCTWNGIELKGKVQFVESFPDIKVQFVDAFPDLKVKFADAFPDDCGEWQVVESFPDFKVQVVESFPDIKVQVVESFPGMP